MATVKHFVQISFKGIAMIQHLAKLSPQALRLLMHITTHCSRTGAMSISPRSLQLFFDSKRITSVQPHLKLLVDLKLIEAHPNEENVYYLNADFAWKNERKMLAGAKFYTPLKVPGFKAVKVEYVPTATIGK